MDTGCVETELRASKYRMQGAIIFNFWVLVRSQDPSSSRLIHLWRADEICGILLKGSGAPGF